MAAQNGNGHKNAWHGLQRPGIFGGVSLPQSRGEAPVITRAEFIRALKREMPDAIDDIRKAGVGPVDMQQSVIGPGMGVFTCYAKVLESDDSPMTVKTALTLINRVWEEIENELDANFDPETQVALAWYRQLRL